MKFYSECPVCHKYIEILEQGMFTLLEHLRYIHGAEKETLLLKMIFAEIKLDSEIDESEIYDPKSKAN